MKVVRGIKWTNGLVQRVDVDFIPVYRNDCEQDETYILPGPVGQAGAAGAPGANGAAGADGRHGGSDHEAEETQYSPPFDYGPFPSNYFLAGPAVNAANAIAGRGVPRAIVTADLPADMVSTLGYSSLPALNSGYIVLGFNNPYTITTRGSYKLHHEGIHVNDPTLVTWTQSNFTGASEDRTCGGIYVSDAANASTFDVKFNYKAAPSTPYVCVYGFIPLANPAAYHHCLVGWSHTSGTALQCIAIRTDVGGPGTGQIQQFNFTSPTVLASNTVLSNFMSSMPRTWWVAIGDDGATNRNVWLSFDRKRWHAVITVARTNHFGAAPGRVMWGVDAYSQNAGMWLLDYEEYAQSTPP